MSRNQWNRKKTKERCQDTKKSREGGGGGKEEQMERGLKEIRGAQKEDRG